MNYEYWIITQLTYFTHLHIIFGIDFSYHDKCLTLQSSKVQYVSYKVCTFSKNRE